MDQPQKIPNIGPKSMQWLSSIGIATAEDIRIRGVVNTYLALLESGFSASLNMLWALAGAAHDCHWNRLPPGLKASLLMEIDAVKEARRRLNL